MSEQGQAAPATKMDLTIQNIGFECAAPYAEGHVLTAPEAGVLNQTRAENLRNNFAKVVKDKIEAAAGETPPRSELNEDEISSLKAAFEEYEAGYEFQGKRTSRAPVDPVKREAVKIAKETILTALRARNIDPKSLKEGNLEQLIQNYIEKNPSVLEEARARVEAVKASAADALAGLDFEPEQAPPAEQEAPAEAPAAEQ